MEECPKCKQTNVLKTTKKYESGKYIFTDYECRNCYYAFGTRTDYEEFDRKNNRGIDTCPKCKNLNTVRVMKFDVSDEGEHISTAYECLKCGYKFRIKMEHEEGEDKSIPNEHYKSEIITNTEQLKTTNLNENQG